MHQQEVYSTSGSVFKTTEMVGDLGALGERSMTSVSQRFELSDEAYREIVSRKEYYALKTVTHRINTTMLRRVIDIKAKAEEILTRLEEV